MLCFFTVNDFLDIVRVYPFFGKAAAAADVPVYIYARKYGNACHNVIPGTVRAGITVESNYIG